VRFLWRSRRVAVPVLLAVLCLVASGWVAPVWGWLLVMTSFACLMDAGLALMPTTGSLESYRQ